MACLDLIKDEQLYKFERRDLQEVQMALENLICPHNFSEDFLFKEGVKFYDCKNSNSCGSLDLQDSGERTLFSHKMGLNEKQKSNASISLDLADFIDLDANSFYLNGDCDPIQSSEDFTSKDLDLLFSSDKPRITNTMNDENKGLSLEEVSAALFSNRDKYGTVKSPLSRGLSLGFNLNADNFLEHGDWDALFADVTDEDIQAAIESRDRKESTSDVTPSLEIVKKELEKLVPSIKLEVPLTNENQAINGDSRPQLESVKVEVPKDSTLRNAAVGPKKRRAPLLLSGDAKMRNLASSESSLTRRDKIKRWLDKRHRRIFSRKGQLGRTAKGKVAQRKRRNHLGRFV